MRICGREAVQAEGKTTKMILRWEHVGMLEEPQGSQYSYSRVSVGKSGRRGGQRGHGR